MCRDHCFGQWALGPYRFSIHIRIMREIMTEKRASRLKGGQHLQPGKGTETSTEMPMGEVESPRPVKTGTMRGQAKPGSDLDLGLSASTYPQ